MRKASSKKKYSAKGVTKVAFEMFWIRVGRDGVIEYFVFHWKVKIL